MEFLTEILLVPMVVLVVLVVVVLLFGLTELVVREIPHQLLHPKVIMVRLLFKLRMQMAVVVELVRLLPVKMVEMVQPAALPGLP